MKDINVLRVVVRESHSEDILEHLVIDIVWAYETLVGMNKQKNNKNDNNNNKEKHESKTKEEKEADDLKKKRKIGRDDKSYRRDRKVDGHKGGKHARHGPC